MRQFAIIVAVILWLFGQSPLSATPFFARTYDMPCQSCHAGYPRLNAFGLAFKANNFRMPGAEDQAILAWQKTLPIAVQMVRTNEWFGPGKSHADFTETQLLAGGLLTKKTSFFADSSLFFNNIPIPFPSYQIWAQQVLNDKSKLMVKAGQFELPYAYSATAELVSSFAPLPFGTGIASNDVRVGSAMRGLQLSGILGSSVRLAAAYGAPSTLTPGNASGQEQFFGQFHDLFIRASTVPLDRNAGAFAYLTRQVRDPSDPGNGVYHGYRTGVDGAYETGGFQFFGMALYGEDKDPLDGVSSGGLRAGFIEADRMLTPWAGVNLRAEAQSTSLAGRRSYQDGRIVGLRIYPIRIIRLTAEFRQGDHGTSDTAVFAGVAF